jgi:hypothetical protein
MAEAWWRKREEAEGVCARGGRRIEREKVCGAAKGEK